MRLFFLPRGAETGQGIEIQGKDFNYLAHVLRRRVGDRFQGADPGGCRWECRIAELGADRLRLQLERPAEAAGERAEPALRLIQALHDALAGDVRSVTLLIGPEGGFAEEEAALARERGFLPIAPGDRLWRTETAALYAVAAVQSILEERETWIPV
jgi:16S rRNA U1498 N3-methylase RsmE